MVVVSPLSGLRNLRVSPKPRASGRMICDSGAVLGKDPPGLQSLESYCTE